MTINPSEQIKLVNSIQTSLGEIQELFDKYQIKCFSAKSPEFFCLELNGEAGELANIEKKQWKGLSVDFDKFEDEAADVFIALMNYCNSRKINIASSVIKKLNKIEEKRQKLESENKKY